MDIVISAITAAEKYGFEPDAKGFIKCPFHDDRNPSLKLYEGNKGFYCFGCGAGGDVVKFVMLLFDISFRQAKAKIQQDFFGGVKRNAGERNKLPPKQTTEQLLAWFYRALSSNDFYDAVKGDYVFPDEVYTVHEKIKREFGLDTVYMRDTLREAGRIMSLKNDLCRENR